MFKFVDGKQKDHLVVIGGWAFDYRIFDTMELPYNYIFFCGECTVDFEAELKKTLEKHNINKISLLGWSQGAFTACDFAGKNPDIIKEIILAGARQKYEKEGLTEIKKYLIKNKRAYLYRFYRRCFSESEEDSYQWFRDSLLKSYLKEMSLERLIEGLDRLGQAEIEPAALKKLNRIKIVHGSADSISPVDEAVELSNSLPQSQLIVFDGAGHLPFLRKDFKKRLYEY